AGHICIRAGEALHKTGGDWIDENHEDDRNRAGRALRSPDSNGAGGHDDIDFEGDEFLSERGEAFGMTLRPPVFDRRGPALGPAQLAQALPKGHGIRVVGSGPAGAEISDPWSPALLGVDHHRREREGDEEPNPDQSLHRASLRQIRPDRSAELRRSAPW